MLLFTLLLTADVPVPPAVPELAQVVDFARVAPDSPLVGKPGRFTFTPGSLPDDVQGGLWCVEAAGADGLLRTVLFAPGEGDEGLDVAAPVVVEGVPVVIRHRASRDFPVLVELQERDARRVR